MDSVKGPVDKIHETSITSLTVIAGFTDFSAVVGAKEQAGMDFIKSIGDLTIGNDPLIFCKIRRTGKGHYHYDQFLSVLVQTTNMKLNIGKRRQHPSHSIGTPINFLQINLFLGAIIGAMKSHCSEENRFAILNPRKGKLKPRPLL